MRLRKAARVILVGAPGVGKGTQSERLLQRFPQLSAISSGDLLRKNVKNRTPLGTVLADQPIPSQWERLANSLSGIKVESTMKAGGLVPDDLILRLISNELTTRGWLRRDPSQILTLASSGMSSATVEDVPGEPDLSEALFLGALPPSPVAASSSLASDSPSASFLLDGFPRTAGQAAMLDSLVPINLAVSLRTPHELLVERISSRWVHEPSGRVYNTGFNPPRVAGKDDVTGEPLVRRADDDPDVYRERLRQFEKASEPLLEFYAKKGVLLEVEGLSSDEISPKLYKEFERRFC